MKKFSLILLISMIGLGQSSFSSACLEEERDRLGRVAALRLALPDVQPPRGLKRKDADSEMVDPEASPPDLKRVRSAPGSGGRGEKEKLRKEPRKLQDILNLFHELKKRGSPEKEKFLDKLDGLPPAQPKPRKGVKRDLSGELKKC